MRSQNRRLATCVAALFSLLTSTGGVSGGTATTRMHIQVTATAWLEYKVLKESTVVKLTKGDLKNGYKDANSNNVISVYTNSANGYVMSLY